jgi:hypothetical protein
LDPTRCNRSIAALANRITPGLESSDFGLIQVITDNAKVFSKANRQRQADIAQAQDRNRPATRGKVCYESLGI